jgi:hypothetical protein
MYECSQQYLMSYRDLFSKPQYKYFVIVLLGFMQCQQARTLSACNAALLKEAASVDSVFRSPTDMFINVNSRAAVSITSPPKDCAA